MKTKFNSMLKRFARYLKRTYKNKLITLLLIGCGVLAWAVCGDLEVIVIMTVCMMPLFLAKKNYIY